MRVVQLEHVLELDKDDGPSKFYLEHIAEMGDFKVTPDWKGEITLKDK